MAIWSLDDQSGIDYQLIQNGFVSKFVSPVVLSATVEALGDMGYDIVSVDAGRWHSEGDMHNQVAAAFNFPDYYGKNFNALDDCLFDVTTGEYGWNPKHRGLVFVIDNIDRFWAENADSAFALIDLFNLNAGRAALYGNRLMCLVRSNDPRWQPPAFGAYSASWNPWEWLNSSRGI